MDVRYPAVIIEDQTGGFCVRFPDMEEAISEGDSLEEALFNAAEVLTLTLEGRLTEGMDVPPLSQEMAGAVYISTSGPCTRQAPRAQH